MSDADAIEDIRQYLGDAKFKALCKHARNVANGLTSVNTFVFALNIRGVCGFPVHAFGRRYFPSQYRTWMEEGTPTEHMGDYREITSGV